MRVQLVFSGNGRTSLVLNAESDAEKSMLSFMGEGQKRWIAAPRYGYRASATEKIELLEEVPANPPPEGS